MTKFITDTMAEEAVQWMMANAATIGEARKKAILAERLVKRVIALEKKRSNAISVSGKEEDAYASQGYFDAVTDEAVAAGEYETIKAHRDSRIALVEAWRSLTASARATGR